MIIKFKTYMYSNDDFFLPEDIWLLILTELTFGIGKNFLFVSKFFNKLFYKSVVFIEKTYIERSGINNEI